MPYYVTPDDTLNAAAADIRTHFAEVDIDFYNHYFNDTAGLEVKVRTKSRLKDVKEYCRWLQRHPPNAVPVRIVVK